MEKNKPAHEIRFGNIKATLWNAESDKGPFYTVTFKRLYRVDGKWKQSHSFSGRDFEALTQVQMLARTWMADHERE